MKTFYYFDGLYLIKNKSDYILNYINTTSKRDSKLN